MGEVEAQAVGGDERAGLTDVRSELAAQRGMQQVRCRVVAAGGVTCHRVHARGDDIVLGEAGTDRNPVGAGTAGREAEQADHVSGIGPVDRQHADVGDLAARFDVERCPIQHHRSLVSGVERLNLLPVAVEECHHPCRGVGRLVPDELVSERLERPAARIARENDAAALLRVERAGRPRAVALGFHRRLVRLAVDRQASLLGQVLGEVERHTERVVEAEDLVAGHGLRSGCRHAVEQVFELGQARGEHGVEPFLLGADGADDRVTVARQFRIGGAHLADDRVDQVEQHRLGEPELLAVPHRPPHDLAQHVAAPLVRRHHAVGDEEGHRAQVIGDDAHRDVRMGERSMAAVYLRPARSPMAARMGVNRSVS